MPLAASLIVAITVTPVLAALFLPHSKIVRNNVEPRFVHALAQHPHRKGVAMAVAERAQLHGQLIGMPPVDDRRAATRIVEHVAAAAVARWSLQ